jgi:hypothetical protein
MNTNNQANDNTAVISFALPSAHRVVCTSKGFGGFRGVGRSRTGCSPSVQGPGMAQPPCRAASNMMLVNAAMHEAA